MERHDLDVQMDPSRSEPVDRAASRPRGDSDSALWAKFAEAATVQAFCRSWIALQCRMIAGVSGGLLLLGPPDRGPFSPAAIWPSPRRDMKYLTATAERALIQRHGLVIKRKPDPEGGARERFDVAYPIEVAGHLHGVVVLDVAARPEPQLQAVQRQLQWGFAWLEVLLRRDEAAKDVTIKQRLQAVLDLTATAVEQDRFYSSATAFVTALATRLDCDRVSLGFVRSGRIHVRAVSHSAEFRKQANLIRAIAAAVLATARGDYRLSAPSVMEAGIQRAAVAPFNGYIAEALARAGDIVRQGQVLCVLDDRDLRLERLKWLSQQEQFVKQYHEAMAKRSAAQVNILTAQIDQAKAQLALLDDQLSRTRLVAPFDGIVVKGDLSQSLGAPVERGQVLFEVAPLETYRVVLQIDERDVANVAVGQKGQLLLAAAPMEGLPFTVEKVTPVSTAREGRNSFRVEARLQSTPEHLRPGMEGVGKIEVDRRLLIWIWTHQVIDWVRLMVWKWLP